MPMIITQAPSRQLAELATDVGGGGGGGGRGRILGLLQCLIGKPLSAAVRT